MFLAEVFVYSLVFAVVFLADRAPGVVVDAHGNAWMLLNGVGRGEWVVFLRVLLFFVFGCGFLLFDRECFESPHGVGVVAGDSCFAGSAVPRWEEEGREPEEETKEEGDSAEHPGQAEYSQDEVGDGCLQLFQLGDRGKQPYQQHGDAAVEHGQGWAGPAGVVEDESWSGFGVGDPALPKADEADDSCKDHYPDDSSRKCFQ